MSGGSITKSQEKDLIEEKKSSQFDESNWECGLSTCGADAAQVDEALESIIDAERSLEEMKKEFATAELQASRVLSETKARKNEDDPHFTKGQFIVLRDHRIVIIESVLAEERRLRVYPASYFVDEDSLRSAVFAVDFDFALSGEQVTSAVLTSIEQAKKGYEEERLKYHGK